MSGCGDSSVERRQLEVRSYSNYFVDQTKTDATALGKGREAGTSPFVVHIFMRGVILQLFVIFSIHFVLSIFKRYFDRLPDSSRDLQIVCDKRIVGAE